MDGPPRPMTAQPTDDPAAGPSPENDTSGDGRETDRGEASLIDDLSSLIEDGRTYAEAELAYQKTRAAFVGQQAKGIAISGGIAALLVVLAIVALVFGAILALTPLVGAFGATGIVFGALLLAAFLLVQIARAKARAMMRAFGSEKE